MTSVCKSLQGHERAIDDTLIPVLIQAKQYQKRKVKKVSVVRNLMVIIIHVPQIHMQVFKEQLQQATVVQKKLKKITAEVRYKENQTITSTPS